MSQLINRELITVNIKDRLRILHVDDDPGILQVAKSILEMESNFEVDNALSVNEAVKKMKAQSYDAVVSDYEMPQKNGLDFLKELREQNNQIPFILFTGRGREDVAVKALNLGADRYLDKTGAPETVYCELAYAINDIVERKKSKKELAESELKYRTVVEKSLQGILITQTSPLRLIFANESMGEILGYSTEELKLLSPEGIAGLIYNEDRTVFFKRLESRMRGEPALSSLEFRAVRKDGSIVWLEAFASRIEYMGKPVVQGMFLDIDERKKVSGILRESEERYRELANSLPDIVFESDVTGKLVFVNERAPEISGYSQGELEKGLNVLQFIAPEDRERAMKSIQRLLAGGGYVPAEYVFLRKDGTTFPALITTTLCISKNKVTGLRGLVLDITERKKSEKQIESLARFTSENPDAVLRVDSNSKILYSNPASQQLANFIEIEAGKNSPKSWKSHIKEALSTSKQIEFEENYENRAYWFKIIPIISEGYVNVYGTEITERKKTEELLKESVTKYRDFTESLPEIVFEIDIEGNIVFVNQRASQITGYNQQELGTVNFVRLVVPAELEKATAHVNRLISGENVGPIEYNLIKKDGVVFPVIVWANPYIVQSKVVGLRGIIVDISERKKAEEEKSKLLHDLNERAKELNCLYGMSRIFEKSDIPLDVALLQTVDLLPPAMKYPEIACARIVIENREFSTKNFAETKLKLKTNIKTIGKKVGFVEVRYLEERPTIAEGPFLKEERHLIEAVAERLGKITERKDAEEKLKESEEKYQTSFESSMDALMLADENSFLDCNTATLQLFGCKSVEEFTKYHPADLSPPTQPDGSPSMEAAMNHINEAFKTGMDSFFWIHKRMNGTTFPADVLLTRMPLKGRDVLQATVRDITERKEAEEKLKENSERIEIMNEKLHVIGALTRHDVRNKLSAVTGYAYLLKKKHADQADIIEGLGKIEQSVKEVTKIFDFARMYEQLGVEELSYVDVEKTLDEAAGLFSGLTIKVVNDCHDLAVLADSFLRQLFYNFVDNTRKYGNKATTIRVYFEKAESGGLRLIYEDDGVGISPENKLMLFKEGFSTGGSTGFGLFLIKKMTDVYGWQIQETGQLDKGVKFVMSIPKLNKKGENNFQTKG